MRRGSVFLALVLIVLGAYLLLQQLDIGIPDWDVIWPVFPLAAGLALLYRYLSSRRDPGLVFVGTAATLVGLAFFFITLGPLQYEDLGVWWPAFVIIGGVAFLAQWAATGFLDRHALFLAAVALVVGAAGLAVTLQFLGPQTRELLPQLWPAFLILVGLMMLLRALVGRRSR